MNQLLSKCRRVTAAIDVIVTVCRKSVAVFRRLSNDIALKGFLFNTVYFFYFILRCDSDRFLNRFLRGLFSA